MSENKFKGALNKLLGRSKDMKYDALKLCADLGDQYEVDPAVMYPATVKRIQEVLGGDPPVEIVSKNWVGIPWRDPVVENFIKEAETIQDWNSAAGLAFAKSWFKRALALQVGQPPTGTLGGKGVRIHFKKNLDYRR